MSVEVSVVVPVYDCEGCLVELHRRVTAVLEERVASFELLLVDDRSTDGSWQTLVELAAKDSRVRALRLSRNFGQHAAITAGMAEASGQWTVVMDCDLQDPPEEIPRLLAKAREGYDVVFAKRRQRRQSPLRRLGNRAYFWLRSRLAGVPLETEHSNLSALSQKAREAFLRVRDQHRNFLLVLYWLGFDQASIDYEHAPRFAGQSAYTFRRLLRVAVDGLLFQTTTLLRWIVYFGFAVAGLSLLLAAYLVTAHFTVRTYPGWTSLAVIVLLIGGFIIAATGVTGLYVGKVFEQVKDRPLYLVDERVGGTAEAVGAEDEPRALEAPTARRVERSA